MTYPSHPSAPVRRHSTPVPPLPDYGRIRRPARADEPRPVVHGHGYGYGEGHDEGHDSGYGEGYGERAEPAYAPDDRFCAPAAYRDGDHAGYGEHERYDPPGYDHPGQVASRQGGWDDDDAYDADPDDGYADDGYADDGYADDGYADEGYADDEWDDDDWGPQRTNRMAKWGLGLAFFFSPLGLIFSLIGLVQAPRRGERGRGLAIAGLIVSAISIALGVLYGQTLAKDLAHRLLSDTASSTGPAAQSSAGAPAPAAGPAPATVLDACNALMPALVSSDQQMTAATTSEQAVQVITSMRSAVEQAAGAPDPTFQQHVQKLADDLQVAIDATTTGTPPAGLTQTLQDDSFAVGTDCGLAGWTQ